MKTPSQSSRTILAVDDDDINLMILVKTAQDAGYKVKPFTRGEEARNFLFSNPGVIDIALLDKMMPGVGGMDLLSDIKLHPDLKHIPVILQTGDVGVAQVCEGLENGAYYYLTKPFHPEILVAILHAANNECSLREELLAQIPKGKDTFLTMLEDAEFTFSTHEKARILAASLAQLSSSPEFVSRGLMELFSNAIEHGCLDIGFEAKRMCLLSKKWDAELEERSNNPEFNAKQVRIQVQRMQSSFQVIISDLGKGFDWRKYVNGAAKDEVNQVNGRGISIARSVLQEIQYSEKGNVVYCKIDIANQASLSGKQKIAV